MALKEFIEKQRPNRVMTDHGRSFEVYAHDSGIILRDVQSGECRGMGALYMFEVLGPQWGRIGNIPLIRDHIEVDGKDVRLETFVKDQRATRIMKDQGRVFRFYTHDGVVILEDKKSGECRGLRTLNIFRHAVRDEDIDGEIKDHNP